MLSDYQDQALELLEDHLFDDPAVTESITWKLYKGHSEAAQQITIPDAALVRLEIGEVELENGVKRQQAEYSYLIKASSLTDGVTVSDLTRNDKLRRSGKDLTVVELNKTFPYAVFVRAVGTM